MYTFISQLKLKYMSMLDQIISAIKDFLFGKVAVGERPQEPSFKSTYPEGHTEYSEANFSSWFNEVNFGKRLTNRPIFW